LSRLEVEEAARGVRIIVGRRVFFLVRFDSMIEALPRLVDPEEMT